MNRSCPVIVVLVLGVALFSQEILANEREAKEGKILYFKHCEICHGPEGKGDGYAHFNPPVVDLTVSEIQKKPDRELWDSIHKGVPNTAMGMWRFVLSDEEIVAALGYVRSLAP